MTPDPRHVQRRGAVLALYQYDAGRGDDLNSIRDGLIAAAIPEDLVDDAMATAADVWQAREGLDERIAELAPTWPANRQPAMDREILRLGLWELLQAIVPPAVAIDEAIELAHEFGTDQTATFVNGVLDAARAALHQPTSEP